MILLCVSFYKYVEYFEGQLGWGEAILFLSFVYLTYVYGINSNKLSTWLSKNFASAMMTTMRLPNATVSNQPACRTDFMLTGAWNTKRNGNCQVYYYLYLTWASAVGTLRYYAPTDKKCIILNTNVKMPGKNDHNDVLYIYHYWSILNHSSVMNWTLSHVCKPISHY